jgi:hypothetical protein
MNSKSRRVARVFVISGIVFCVATVIQAIFPQVSVWPLPPPMAVEARVTFRHFLLERQKEDGLLNLKQSEMVGIPALQRAHQNLKSR